eukprot:g2011.t1
MQGKFQVVRLQAICRGWATRIRNSKCLENMKGIIEEAQRGVQVAVSLEEDLVKIVREKQTELSSKLVELATVESRELELARELKETKLKYDKDFESEYKAILQSKGNEPTSIDACVQDDAEKVQELESELLSIQSTAKQLIEATTKEEKELQEVEERVEEADDKVREAEAREFAAEKEESKRKAMARIAKREVRRRQKKSAELQLNRIKEKYQRLKTTEMRVKNAISTSALKSSVLDDRGSFERISKSLSSSPINPSNDDEKDNDIQNKNDKHVNGSSVVERISKSLSSSPINPSNDDEKDNDIQNKNDKHVNGSSVVERISKSLSSSPINPSNDDEKDNDIQNKNDKH